MLIKVLLDFLRSAFMGADAVDLVSKLIEGDWRTILFIVLTCALQSLAQRCSPRLQGWDGRERRQGPRDRRTNAVGGRRSTDNPGQRGFSR